MILISSLEGGGAERAFTNLSAYFVDLGWDITVVTLSAADLDVYRLDARVRRVSLGLLGDNRNFLHRAVLLVKRLVAIRRVFMSHRPDVVVGVMPSSAVMCILAATGTGILVIAAERTYPPAMPLPRPWSMLRQWLYRYAAAIVVQTATAAAWVRQNCNPQRVAIIPNACQWPPPDHDPVVRPPEDSRFVFAAGRLGIEKGFDLLIEAWAMIAERFPDVRLMIAGEGEEHDRLHARIVRHDLAQSVRLCGRIGNIADWFTAADVFVLASRFEGFPNVLVEAMAAGCAVVAFDCCAGPRDIVRDGIDGRLVPAGDVAALASALADMLNDPAKCAAYGAAARHIADRLSAERVYGQWRDLFLSCREN